MLLEMGEPNRILFKRECCVDILHEAKHHVAIRTLTNTRSSSCKHSPVTEKPYVAAKAKILTSERTHALSRSSLSLTEVEAVTRETAVSTHIHRTANAQTATHLADEIAHVLPPQLNPTVGAELHGYE